MRMFKILFWCIWRLWFYILVLVPIIIMSPFLTLSLTKDSWYPYFFKMARLWAKIVLYGMGFYYTIKDEQNVLPNHSYMFIANHTSMTDVMLMLAVVKNPFVFVGKKELVKIPIFGFFYKRAAIMVDRESIRSRSEVYERAKARIKQGLSICIFPEGKVPDDESVILDEFKSGAFNIAIDHQLTIVPMVFYDNKTLFSYTFFSGRPGRLRVKFLPFVKTEGMVHDDKKIIKDKSRNLIINELISDPTYMKHSMK
ncbi:lysophospholipid acyltransferase family protein [Flavobacterium oreochromis]|uniref:lysophospholipid acyltransferase family protein n=1 Tax=Flavobacterium oreochromis TaxID=2906078 RepID=UPI000CDB8C66|nr:lysophospholipid acyltransferase family protein [Flavobacterium oreochromis]POR24715.1 1-acyl-sn-glycerol-3-phosphate acyltransferase [Flavobacterium columnare]QYS87017.1 1-acyl-sn-glycerol-3-phosphate acyltransferase [Flavobacterium oreochromis]